MKQEVTNFARFYALLKQMPGRVDRESLKRSLVLQCTGNRTESLREMTRQEYEVCCLSMERLTDYSEKLRRQRSSVLKLMQQLGIDTTDWNRINAFCEDARIDGRPFARIKLDELARLEIKLRSIKRKGGLRKLEEETSARFMASMN